MFPKNVRDPVHGIIKFTDVEYKLLQHPILMRLHYIHQTNTAFLSYPAMKHTRLDHSIGVMHLAGRITRIILDQLNNKNYEELFGKSKNDREFFNKIIETMRLAGLLHDIGQGPFSHVSEVVMSEILSEDEKIEMQKLSLKTHEYYSYRLVKKEIRELFDEWRVNINVNDIASIISGKVENDCEIINKNNLNLLRQVIVSQLDADRMDYLMRDSYFSGEIYGTISIDRIIENIVVYHKDNQYQLALHYRAKSNIEDFIDARYKMYKYVYFLQSVVNTDSTMRLFFLSKRMEEDRKYLHYKYYKDNDKWTVNTDFGVLNRLTESTNKEPWYCFIDRRYMPVPLWKRVKEFSDIFIDKYIERKKLVPSREDLIKDIIKTCKKGEKAEKIGEKFEEIGNEEILIITDFGRSVKIYEAVREPIKLYFGENKPLIDLKNVSPYVEQLLQLEEGLQMPYIFYFIKGETRNEAKRKKRKILDEVVSIMLDALLQS